MNWLFEEGMVGIGIINLGVCFGIVFSVRELLGIIVVFKLLGILLVVCILK